MILSEMSDFDALFGIPDQEYQSDISSNHGDTTCDGGSVPPVLSIQKRGCSPQLLFVTLRPPDQGRGDGRVKTMICDQHLADLRKNESSTCAHRTQNGSQLGPFFNCLILKILLRGVSCCYC